MWFWFNNTCLTVCHFLVNSCQENSQALLQKIQPVSTLANSDTFLLQNITRHTLYLDCQGRFEGSERVGSRGRPLWVHTILRQPKRDGRLPFLEDWLLVFSSRTQEIPHQVRPQRITIMYGENTDCQFHLYRWYVCCNILKCFERILLLYDIVMCNN